LGHACDKLLKGPRIPGDTRGEVEIRHISPDVGHGVNSFVGIPAVEVGHVKPAIGDVVLQTVAFRQEIPPLAEAVALKVVPELQRSSRRRTGHQKKDCQLSHCCSPCLRLGGSGAQILPEAQHIREGYYATKSGAFAPYHPSAVSTIHDGWGLVKDSSWCAHDLRPERVGQVAFPSKA
jgi:hypothetical protein